MASRQSQKRLAKEYKKIERDPPPFIIAKPSEENILEWHYIITGPPETPFEGGQYHGILRFAPEYPFKPPSILMVTPNGRFACNTRLCLTISDYHPETWNPGWSVESILTGLLSFMTGDEITTGSILSSDNLKRKLAKSSKEWNNNENVRYRKEFPELVAQNKIDIENQKRADAANDADTLSQKDVPIDLKKHLELLDPEERARLLAKLDQQEILSTISRPAILGISFALVLAFFVKFYK